MDDENVGFGKFFENSLKYAAYILETLKSESPEVQRSIDFLKSYEGKLVMIMNKSLIPRPEDERYRMITHGDTWNNNIMFLHDSRGKVVQVKLVDFQVY